MGWYSGCGELLSEGGIDCDPLTVEGTEAAVGALVVIDGAA